MEGFLRGGFFLAVPGEGREEGLSGGAGGGMNSVYRHPAGLESADRGYPKYLDITLIILLMYDEHTLNAC